MILDYTVVRYPDVAIGTRTDMYCIPCARALYGTDCATSAELPYAMTTADTRPGATLCAHCGADVLTREDSNFYASRAIAADTLAQAWAGRAARDMARVRDNAEFYASHGITAKTHLLGVK